MAKNKTEIHVTTVFDGELDATDVFVSLISQKYGKTNTKEYLAKKRDMKYNEDEVQKSQIPSGLCGLGNWIPDTFVFPLIELEYGHPRFK